MVAWIKEFPDTAPRPWRALISQDGFEIYVSMFEYDWAWESYINGSPRLRAGHAKMNMFVHPGFGCRP
ncbi:hypothetical protein DTO271G3_7058 [Paecilomyces variotii]|nr:hypothetical protein DTO271G3_7058 [Paecilomyces variotii]